MKAPSPTIKRYGQCKSFCRQTNGQTDGKTDKQTGQNYIPPIYRCGCIRKVVVKCNGLTHSHTMTPFDAPGKQAF